MVADPPSSVYRCISASIMTAAPPAVSLFLPDTLSSAETQTAIAELKAINADKIDDTIFFIAMYLLKKSVFDFYKNNQINFITYKYKCQYDTMNMAINGNMPGAKGE